MARIARIVVPGLPHLLLQRGNRDLPVFFSTGDSLAYLELLRKSCHRAGTRILAWCLTPNSVRLLLVPAHADGLRAAVAEAHRRYTREINQRRHWRGHLWQERFQSFALGCERLTTAARYVEQTPQRLGLIRQAGAWRWSSAAAHLTRRDDRLTTPSPALDNPDQWRALLAESLPHDYIQTIEQHLANGRPWVDETTLTQLEARLGKPLRPGRRGRPRKQPTR